MISRLRSSSTIESGGASKMDDVVRALAMAIDRVGQPAAPPRGDLHDLAAGRRDLAGDPVDQGLALVVGQVRSEDEHQFVSAHARMTPSCGNALAEPALPGRSRKDKDASLAWVSIRLRRPDSPAGPLYPESDPTAPIRRACAREFHPAPRARPGQRRPGPACPVGQRRGRHGDGGRSGGDRRGGRPLPRDHRRDRSRDERPPTSAGTCAPGSPWPRSRSCASASPTTSRSGSASWKPAPTT